FRRVLFRSQQFAVAEDVINATKRMPTDGQIRDALSNPVDAVFELRLPGATTFTQVRLAAAATSSNGTFTELAQDLQAAIDAAVGAGKLTVDVPGGFPRLRAGGPGLQLRA